MFYKKPAKQIYFDRNQSQFVSIDELVPQDHLVRYVEAAIDFHFIYHHTQPLYDETLGRPCLDPVILFKIMLLNFLYGKNSVRATLEETKVNMAYRWFLGLGVHDEVPHYSTFSQNYIRRFRGTKVFEHIFASVLNRIMEHKLIDSSLLFVDGTHVKASANKHKRKKMIVKATTDIYKDAIEQEVNQYREDIGRNPFDYNDDDDDDTPEVQDEETGEIISIKKSTEQTKSTTDKDAGMYVKGEKERQFAYVDQVACDKYGWIVAHQTNPGNIHDAKAFLPFYNEVLSFVKPSVICADSAYVTPKILHRLSLDNVTLIGPYQRPKGKKTSSLHKSDFTYQLEIDAYLCPNLKWLKPYNITRDGQVEYKIYKYECADCPMKDRCIKQATHKTVQRHLYEDLLWKAKQDRLSKEGKEWYKQRKHTIERIFAQGKEQHGLRHTRVRGLQKNRDYRSLLYACMNLKKLALLFKRREESSCYSY